MADGWNAAGLIEAVWLKPPFGTRDKLAAATGILGNELSSYNTGKKNLGIANARRIADAAGISVVELGAPEAEDQRGRSVLARQEELEAATLELTESVRRLTRRVAALERQARAAAGT